MFGRSYTIRKFLQLAGKINDWQIQPIGKKYAIIAGENRVVLSAKYAAMVFEEWCNDWERYYLPPFSLQEKIVLDIGSGEGETAWFYNKHGASKVICVEPNEDCVKALLENAKLNRWEILVLSKPFDLSMLSKLRFDYMKMDCEHCEEALLQLGSISFPCALEVHSEESMKEFRDRFGFRLRKTIMKHKRFLMNDF